MPRVARQGGRISSVSEGPHIGARLAQECRRAQELRSLPSTIGYGWGYRRWGMPYPSYVQRRRARRADAAGDPVALRHYSWGLGGDLIWMAVIVGIVWALAAFSWGRP